MNTPRKSRGTEGVRDDGGGQGDNSQEDAGATNLRNGVRTCAMRNRVVRFAIPTNRAPRRPPITPARLRLWQ